MLIRKVSTGVDWYFKSRYGNKTNSKDRGPVKQNKFRRQQSPAAKRQELVRLRHQSSRSHSLLTQHCTPSRDMFSRSRPLCQCQKSNPVALLRDKWVALFEGQISGPFWGTNELPFLKDKLIAPFKEQTSFPFDKQISCPFGATNQLPFLRDN